MLRSLLALCTLVFFPAFAMAGIEGVVQTDQGIPVEHARVDWIEGSQHRYSDPSGRFSFEEVEPPAQLVFSHPRFHAQVVDLTEGDGTELVVTLAAKQEIFEEIVVSANRGETGFSPVSIAAASIDPIDLPVPPTTLTEAVVEVPGVSQNGQGGLFQVFSIRGVSRHRVLTLIEGTRVTSDRRAGASASFIEPQLLETVEVVRGPSSTYYGSGALGGVVQLFPRAYESLDVRVGYESQGDENYQIVGWGKDGWSLGLARRDADSAEDPEGDTVFSGFTQTSGTLRKSWSTEKYDWDVLVLGSAGRDIEKASTDYPDRITVYPEENHLLMRLGVVADAGWSLYAYAHPNDLQTEVLRVEESLTSVDNDSTELGAAWQQRFTPEGISSLAIGADYWGRRGVDSRETVIDISSGSPGEITTLQTLSDAEEDQLGVYGAVEWNMSVISTTAGLRGTWQRQVNASLPSTDDSAVTGFLGILAPLGKGFELVSNLGTGLRFPTISERYFSGTTGRGGVIGNPNLDSESSVSVDLGLRWFGEKLFVAGYVYRNEIDDYIERIEIEEDLLTFVNLVSGRIEGIELTATYSLGAGSRVEIGGHIIDGEDDKGLPLADIPANRIHLGASGVGNRWSWSGRYEYRAEKDDPGPGEKIIPSANVLSGHIGYSVSDRVTVSLTGDNLLDEAYFNSADRKVPLSAGRSVGVGFTYSK